MQDGLNARTPRPLGQSMSLNGDPAKLAEYYGDWAANYDADVGDEDYGLPASVMATLDAMTEHMPELTNTDITVLDAGCGTGRIGMVLADRGYTTVNGVDLSPEMVEIATERTTDGRATYAALEAPVDLTQVPSERWMQSADLVVVGGVFTVGHIPPSSLYHVAKLVRPGGALITTVRPGYFDTTDYRDVSATFSSDGTAELLVHFEALPYTADTDGRYYGYRIN